jgi:RNA polymerase sigma-70 factor (ECF subfamily)
LPGLESIENRIRYTSGGTPVWRIRSTSSWSAGLATGGAPCEARSILVGNDKSLASAADEVLIDGLRRGDQVVVFELVEAWSGSMLRLALMFVQARAVAEEVVQDTWIAVLEGIERFESRSTLRTWVFTILTNRAKTRAMRERRSIPFSALEGEGPAVEPERFLPASDGWAGHWAAPPGPLPPEELLLVSETRTHLAAAIRDLPPAQRVVLSLRDIEGWSADEVCNVLELSETNQRVLLHRGRSTVRQALERYLEDTSG